MYLIYWHMQRDFTYIVAAIIEGMVRVNDNPRKNPKWGVKSDPVV